MRLNYNRFTSALIHHSQARMHGRTHEVMLYYNAVTIPKNSIGPLHTKVTHTVDVPVLKIAQQDTAGCICAQCIQVLVRSQKSRAVAPAEA